LLNDLNCRGHSHSPSKIPVHHRPTLFAPIPAVSASKLTLRPSPMIVIPPLVCVVDVEAWRRCGEAGEGPFTPNFRRPARVLLGSGSACSMHRIVPCGHVNDNGMVHPPIIVQQTHGTCSGVGTLHGEHSTTGCASLQPTSQRWRSGHPCAEPATPHSKRRRLKFKSGVR
jgi:hypothetical protein